VNRKVHDYPINYSVTHGPESQRFLLFLTGVIPLRFDSPDEVDGINDRGNPGPCITEVVN